MKTALTIAYGYSVAIFTIATLKCNIGLMLIMSLLIGILAAFIAKD